MSNVDVATFEFLEGVEHADAALTRLMNSGDNNWSVNDTSIKQYGEHWRWNYLGNMFDGDLDEIIEDCIGLDSANVGVDIAGGANGRAIQDLLDSHILGKALVTNYEDFRSEETKEREELDHIDGDILHFDTWRKIIDWRRDNAPDGLAVVMHRPFGPLQYLHEKFYSGAANLLLDLMRPGGIMFAQIPERFLRDAAKLGRMCRLLQAREDIAKIELSKPLNLFEGPHQEEAGQTMTRDHVLIYKK